MNADQNSPPAKERKNLSWFLGTMSAGLNEFYRDGIVVLEESESRQACLEVIAKLDGVMNGIRKELSND